MTSDRQRLRNALASVERLEREKLALTDKLSEQQSVISVADELARFLQLISPSSDESARMRNRYWRARRELGDVQDA